MNLLKNLLTNNISIKIISLILALLTWSYIGGQLYKKSLSTEEEAPSILKVSGEKLIVKRLPVYVNIEGEPAVGYRVVLDRIVVTPSHSVVAGPVDVIEGLLNIITKPIDIAGATKTIRKRIELEAISRCKIGYEGEVNVTIPISRSR